MRWIQYPTEKDRKQKRNGIPREGQLWADAPGGPRRKWMIPADGPKVTYALVMVYDGAPESENYALADWPGAL